MAAPKPSELTSKKECHLKSYKSDAPTDVSVFSLLRESGVRANKKPSLEIFTSYIKLRSPSLVPSPEPFPKEPLIESSNWLKGVLESTW